MSNPSQVLPSKENNLFKAVVRFYETKQYKKGLKAADQILKKVPEHGETLAMKGLTLSCIDGKKEEAYELVRQGLKRDLRSHVCWHVYGLMYRADRDYREAIKCYRNALRLDKENVQILRDLSLLQVQMRDLTGFVETRQQLLTLKPSNRNNWIAFAIAHHLNGSRELAVQVLNAYEGTLEGNVPSSEKYEHGEMLLYRALILEESGLVDEALAAVEKDGVIDKLAALEQKARLLVAKGAPTDAEKIYRKLLAINPDNHKYHFALQGVLGNDVSKIKPCYTGLDKAYPKSSAVKRLPLDFLEGNDFKSAAEQYVLKFLRKGIPSLFSDLSGLYRGPKGPTKAATLEKMFEQAREGLKAEGKLMFATVDASEVEQPDVLIWVNYYLAQHYDHQGRTKEALEAIGAAISHTPSIPDMYLCKARICRNAGNIDEAWKLADEARQMDLADRYLNSECTQIMLQADQVDKAHETIALFARDSDKKESNLHEMQCMWFEREAGYSHLRNEQYPQALAQLNATLSHFADIAEDQFDFHTYCLRKMTLRAYVSLLRMEENLHGHPAYCAAAYGVIRAYLAIHMQDDMSPEELKAVNEAEKYERKKKQIEAKAAKKAAEAAAADGKKATDPKKEEAKEAEKEDPGMKLATKPEPVLEAAKPLELLELHGVGRLETHYLSFHVAMARAKPLLALRALRRMHTLAPTHPQTHACTVRLYHAHAAGTGSADESHEAGVVRKVLEAEKANMLGAAHGDLAACNAAFLATHAASLPHVLAGAQVMVLLSPTDLPKAVALLMAFRTPQALQVQDRRDLHNVTALLKQEFKAEEAATKWVQGCSQVHPMDARFRPAMAAC